MRILFVTAVTAAILASAGNAESPREIVSTDTIEIRTGQARTFMFDEAVSKFSVSAEGIAQITPETDRTFTVQGLSPGQVRIPTKPAMHSNSKPAGYSDLKPATRGVVRMGQFHDVVEGWEGQETG